MTQDAAPLVSIIMPVYNVEKYVGAAIASMQAQTLPDFEFLIVDDGSTDGSGAICDRYAAEDARIQVFHRANAGAPAARNFAMDCARGRYLYFMDADDWAEPVMLKELCDLAQVHRAQLVIAGFFIETYAAGKKAARGAHAGSEAPANTAACFTEVHAGSPAVYNSASSFRNRAWELFDDNLLYPPWNKLYLRSYLEEKQLRFPQTFWDDFPFVLSVIRDISHVVVTDKPYYHFIRARGDSETARYRAGMYEKREEEHAWMLEIYEHWGITGGASAEMVQRRYAERLVGCIENVCNPASGMSRFQMRAAVRQMIRTPQAIEAAHKARPRTRMLRWMLWPIREQHPYLAYLEGRFISLVKRRFSLLFARLKAGR